MMKAFRFLLWEINKIICKVRRYITVLWCNLKLLSKYLSVNFHHFGRFHHHIPPPPHPRSDVIWKSSPLLPVCGLLPFFLLFFCWSASNLHQIRVLDGHLSDLSHRQPLCKKPALIIQICPAFHNLRSMSAQRQMRRGTPPDDLKAMKASSWLLADSSELEASPAENEINVSTVECRFAAVFKSGRAPEGNMS